MEILSSLFVDDINFRQVEGPATRIDMSGIYFSVVAPSPPPVTLQPHLIVLVRCGVEETGDEVLEVVFKDQNDKELARSQQSFQVEPGRFGYRLVKADISFEEYGTVNAVCKLGQSQTVTVPLTLLPAPGNQ